MKIELTFSGRDEDEQEKELKVLFDEKQKKNIYLKIGYQDIMLDIDIIDKIKKACEYMSNE